MIFTPFLKGDWEEAKKLCFFFLWHEVLTKAIFEEALPCISTSFEQDAQAIIQVYYRLGPIFVVFDVVSICDDDTVLASVIEK